MDTISTIIGTILSSIITFFIDYLLNKKYKKKFNLDTFCQNYTLKSFHQSNSSNIQNNNNLNINHSFNNQQGNITINQNNTTTNNQTNNNVNINTNKASDDSSTHIILLIIIAIIVIIAIDSLYILLRKNIYFNIFFPITIVLIFTLNKFLFLHHQEDNSKDLLNYNTYVLISFFIFFTILIIFINPYINKEFISLYTKFTNQIKIVNMTTIQKIYKQYPLNFLFTLIFNIIGISLLALTPIIELYNLIKNKKSILINRSPIIISICLFIILILIYILPNLFYLN